MGQGLILQSGIHWTRSKGKPGGPGPEPTYTYYVDSVNGDDSNPGTAAEPFATLANIVWDNDVTVGFARGSHFREQIDTGAYSGVQVRAYGDPLQPMPVFDCSDISTAVWVEIDPVSAPGVWQTATPLVTEDDLYTMYPSIWFDGERLLHSTDVVATSGTWYAVAAPALDTYEFTPTIHVDFDPNTKLVEFASRWFGVALGDNSYMEFIRTKRNLHNNGSASLGENSEGKFCLFEDGVKHNAYYGRNSRFTSCTAYRSDWPSRDNHSFFVGHALDGSGATSSTVDCLAYGELEKIQWAEANSGSIGGFLWHTSGEVGESWQTVQITHSTAKNCNVGFETNTTTSVSLTEAWADGCFKGIKLESDYVYTQELKVTENDGIRINRGFELNTAVNGLHVRSRLYTVQGASDGLVYNYSSSGITTFQNCVFYRNAGGSPNYNYMIRSLNSGHAITLDKSVMYDAQSAGSESCFISAATPVASLNVTGNYFGGSDNVDWELDGRTFFSYPAVIADATVGPRFVGNVQDVPSSVQDAANGLFYSVLGGTADAMGAGINYYIDRDVTYQPILTYSELDAM